MKAYSCNHLCLTADPEDAIRIYVSARCVSDDIVPPSLKVDLAVYIRHSQHKAGDLPGVQCLFLSPRKLTVPFIRGT
jgi:hypothetical protein